ncbi:MAG: hypothetical protein K0M66_06515 [Thiobacillus sp.]|nr:hypothetical protein [Thiobacillus sp.]
MSGRVDCLTGWCSKCAPPGLWATLAGIAIRVLSGAALGHLGWKLRSVPNAHTLMDDFLGLGLIGVAKAVVELRAGRLQAMQPSLSRPRPK